MYRESERVMNDLVDEESESIRIEIDVRDVIAIERTHDSDTRIVIRTGSVNEPQHVYVSRECSIRISATTVTIAD
jgi:hypothetical protein